MASISVSSKTTSSVTLYVSGLYESWTNGTRTVHWYLGSAGGGIPTPSAYYKQSTSTIADAVSSGGYVTFSGLSASTKYGIYCEIYHGSTLLTPDGLQGYVTTDSKSGGTSIAKWSWSAGNRLASAKQTLAAYLAVENQASTLYFSHYVWDDMVMKVKEIIDETVGYWDTDYATLQNTRMINESYELTADRFNSLRNNLELAGLSVGLSKIPDGYTSGEIPHPVYSRNDNVPLQLKTVYGHYFITLAHYINDCIDYL